MESLRWCVCSYGINEGFTEYTLQAADLIKKGS
jgi:hypothetical protein